METKLVVFKDKEIRRTLLDNEWYFAVVDVVAALTDSNKPRDYWYRMKKREAVSSGFELSTICRQLKLDSSDGKMYKTEVSNTEGIFRIIQESKRAAHKEGEVAGKARKDLEQKTRKKVVSPENYLSIPQKEQKQLNEKE